MLQHESELSLHADDRETNAAAEERAFNEFEVAQADNTAPEVDRLIDVQLLLQECPPVLQHEIESGLHAGDSETNAVAEERVVEKAQENLYASINCLGIQRAAVAKEYQGRRGLMR